jgi:hypothetical protein
MPMSSHKNKVIRQRLEKIYGKGCMFQKAYIAERIEKMGGIKTYKQYQKEHKYTLKKVKRLEETMSLHHLKHRSEGGSTSERNGAVVNALAHAYLHSLPRQQEEIINNMLREYKECGVQFVDDLDTGIELNLAEISYDNELKVTKKKFSRSETKKETREKIRQWEEGR